jgi:hypothetical protein
VESGIENQEHQFDRVRIKIQNRDEIGKISKHMQSKENKSAREGAFPPEKQQRLKSMKTFQSYPRGEGKHHKRKCMKCETSARITRTQWRSASNLRQEVQISRMSKERNQGWIVVRVGLK